MNNRINICCGIKIEYLIAVDRSFFRISKGPQFMIIPFQIFATRLNPYYPIETCVFFYDRLYRYCSLWYLTHEEVGTLFTYHVPRTFTFSETWHRKLLEIETLGWTLIRCEDFH